jgi:hypothetical protein
MKREEKRISINKHNALLMSPNHSFYVVIFTEQNGVSMWLKKLFTTGNKEVQNVIFNVFIYSVTSFYGNTPLQHKKLILKEITA